MTEEEIITRLQKEGYDNVWVYEAPALEVDEEHSHDFDTKLYILSGEIRITLDGAVETVCTEGSEIEIPREKLHSAVVGAQGCKYVVAERHAK